jgi:hypothetical protein
LFDDKKDIEDYDEEIRWNYYGIRREEEKPKKSQFTRICCRTIEVKNIEINEDLLFYVFTFVKAP